MQRWGGGRKMATKAGIVDRSLPKSHCGPRQMVAVLVCLFATSSVLVACDHHHEGGREAPCAVDGSTLQSLIITSSCRVSQGGLTVVNLTLAGGEIDGPGTL